MSQQEQQLQPLTFPLHGTRLIEASAGTGKTYTLAALYVRLVLGHGVTHQNKEQEPTALALGPLLPPQILVMTFTEAATEELRGRILMRLLEAAQAFEEHDSDDPFLQELVASYDEELHFACQKQLLAAAEWMDEAAILTIHGWCNRMLAEYSFDSGQGFDEVITTDETELNNKVFQDLIRQHYYLLPLHVLQYIEHSKSTVSISNVMELVRSSAKLEVLGDALYFQGVPVVNKGDFRQFTANVEAWQQQVDRAFASLTPEDYASALQLLNEEYNKKTSSLNGNKFKTKSWCNESGQGEITTWQALASGDLVLTGAIAAEYETLIDKFSQQNVIAWTKKSFTPLTHPVFTVFDQFLSLMTQAPQPSDLVGYILDWSAQKREVYKRQAHEIGFNDLLTRLHFALEGADGNVLAEKIKQQFPVAMVDEFQDTDVLQFSMLRSIYQDADATDSLLALVGDPKQSIYAFRGADLDTYLTARNWVGDKRRYYLPRNFRSTKEMIAAVNGLFNMDSQFPEGVFMMGSEQGNPLPFIPVDYAPKKQRAYLHDEQAGNYRALDTMHYWEVMASDFDKSDLTNGDYLQAMSGATAAQVSELLRNGVFFEVDEDHIPSWFPCVDASDADALEREQPVRRVQPDDIAILVRTSREAQQMQAALNKLSIPSVYLSDRSSVFESQEAKAVYYWLDAIWHYQHERKIREALLFPVTHYSDEQAQAWYQESDTWEKIYGQFKELNQYWQQYGVQAVLHRMLYLFDVGKNNLQFHFGERRLSNILHLAEILQEQSRLLDGHLSLLRWLQEHIQHPNPSGEYQQRIESDAQRVKVVTYHKSKGLQYSFVFLPYILTSRETKVGSDASYRNSNGELVFDLQVNSETSKKAVIQHNLEENMRILYVAMTRAVYGCWLGLGKLKKTDGNAMARLLNHIDLKQTGFVQLPWNKTGQDYASTSHWQLQVPAKRLAQALSTQPWSISSYSRLSYRADTKNDNKNDNQNAEADAITATFEQHQDSKNEQDLVEHMLQADVYSEPQGIHAFPKGPHAGTMLHDMLETACKTGMKELNPRLQEDIQRRLERQGWGEHETVCLEWMAELLDSPVPTTDPDGASLLRDLAYRVAEMEFLFAAEQVNVEQLDRVIQQHCYPGVARPPLDKARIHGMLKGFIDLTYQDSQGRFFVLDYKSNWLGTDDSAYTQEAMTVAMMKHRYDVQASLYALALHRLLQSRLPDYDLGRLSDFIGGAVYWFIRSPRQGLWHWQPTAACIQALDALFLGKEKRGKEKLGETA